MKTMYWG